MKILVCLKQVPHQDARLDVNADGTWITEDNIKFEVRQDLRQLDLSCVQYDIAVISAALAFERVYSTQLELSLGLSAWKVYGTSRWSLRINPSSGNLHPTEAHLILPAMKGLEAKSIFGFGDS